VKGKFVTIFIFAILIGSGIIFFQFWNPNKPSISPLKAIPLNTAILIKVNGVLPLISQIENNSLFKNSNDRALKDLLVNEKIKLDSLCHEISYINDILNDSSVYLSVTFNQPPMLGYMFFVNFPSNLKLEKIESQIQNVFAQNGNISSRYGSNDYSESEKHWYYYLEQGLLVIGNNFKDVDASFHQIKRGISLLNDTAFERLSNTTGKNVIANIYLNNGLLKKMSGVFCQPDLVKYIENTLSSNGWMAFDINIDQEFISYQGFSSGNASKSIWSKLLQYEQPVESQIYHLIPKNTLFYNVFSFSDPFNFSLAIKDKIRKDRRFNENIDELREKFGFDVDQKISEILGDAVVFLQTENENSESQQFCIIKTTEQLETQNLLQKMNIKEEETIKKKSNKKKKKSVEPEIIADTVSLNVPIFAKLPSDNLPNILFGETFFDYNYSVACNYKENLIFGQSKESLESLIHQLEQNQLLVNDTVFKSSCYNLFSSRNNSTGYINLKTLWEQISSSFKSGFSEKLEDVFISGSGMPVIGYQLSGNNELTYNNGFIYLKNEELSGNQLRWTADIDTTASQIFELNYKTSKHKAILIEDVINQLYYVTLKGTINWKKNIDGKILGSPSTIKYYKDKGQCLIFNTENYLYIIDTEGNDVDDYPVKFKSKATNGLTVADFDNDQDYRIYIAFENKSFVALTKNGSKLDGWNFEKTNEPVSLPALCYSYDKKDYIIICDNKSLYVLNRKGEPRIDIQNNGALGIIKSISIDSRSRYFRIMVQDETNKIKAIYPDGHVEKIEPAHAISTCFFAMADVDGDKEKDFIFADSTLVFALNIKGEKLFSTILPTVVNSTFLAGKKYNSECVIIGSNAQYNSIFMINSNGEISKDSPLNGISPIIFISLTDLNQSSGLVCSGNNQILYYSIR
jgi:hypothetical protein